VTRDVTESAADRLQRALYTASGIGAVVFGGLLVSGDSGIIAQRAVLAPWFWWASVITVLAVPASLAVIARVAPVTAARAVAVTSVAGFLAVQALWVPAMTVPTLGGATPWIQGVTALPATLAGTTWRSRWVWLFPLMQGPIVTVVQLLSSDRATLDAILDGVGALVFCSILTGVAQAVVGAGDSQDRAAARARKAASEAAGSATSQRERARIDAIVHDDIMSVLLAASRADDSTVGDVAPQARDALAAVTAIAAPLEDNPEELTCERTEALLRATVSALSDDASFAGVITGAGTVPVVAVAAAAEAVGEALQNARRHAGAGATVSVTARITGDRLVIRVQDTGVGFDPRAVAPTRLGIRASIAGRMATIPGGRGTVTSKPGRGTTVAITWVRP
jgi:signal transduction histidine kinase